MTAFCITFLNRRSMGNPKVNITTISGGLGLLPTQEDGIPMLIILNMPQTYFDVLTGTSKFIKLISQKQAEGIGITEANDLSNEAAVWEQVKDFYSLAEENSELHIFFPVADDFDTVFTYDEATVAYDLDQYLSDNDQIKVVGVTTAKSIAVLPTPNDDNLVLTPELDTIGADFTTAVATLQAWVTRQQGRNYRYQAFMGLWDFAAGESWANIASNSPDLREQTADRVGVLVANDKERYDELSTSGLDSKHSQLGLLLAKVATIPVQRNIGRVRDGALPVSIGTLAGTAVNQVKMPDATADTLTDKGYIFYVKYPGRAGFFYNDDPTAAPNDNDFRIVANGRVIDKIARITYETLLDYVKDEVFIDPSNGKISATYAKAVEGEVEAAINAQMTDANELSGGVSASINISQNVLATEALDIDVSAIPVGYSKTITATVAFNNPLTTS